MLQMLLPQLHGAVNGNLPGYPGRCVCRFSENRLGTRDVHRNDRIVAVLFENDPKNKKNKKKWRQTPGRDVIMDATSKQVVELTLEESLCHCVW